MPPLTESSNSPRTSLSHSFNSKDSSQSLSRSHSSNNSTPRKLKPSTNLGHSHQPQQQHHSNGNTLHNNQRHTPKVAALARLRDASLQHSPGRAVSAQNNLLLNNNSNVAGGNGTASGSGGAVAGPGLVLEPQRFEEWMKIATDNKITSNNTWTLALIDYFHDMRLLRNTDGNSINFQKASCTLDGCVKIWTSRVDSVATETGKLLSGLAEDGNGRAGGMDDDDEEGEGDDDEDDGGNRRAKRTTSKAAATLADKFDKIRVKNLELEFTVDPLFKKTSADFDEGGAGGILMNHLGCDGKMRVVFDAGDAKLDDEDEEANPEDDDDYKTGQKVDLSRLLYKHIRNMDDMAEKTLCPSLSSFKFSSDSADLPFFNNPEDDVLPHPRNGGAVNAGNASLNNLTAAAALHLANGAGAGGDDSDDVFRDVGDFGNDDDDVFGPGPSGSGQYTGPDGQEDFFADLGMDSNTAGNQTGGGGGGISTEIDIDVSLADGLGIEDGLGGLGGGRKGWAGPEHWKMRRVVKKDEPAVPKVRKEKVAFSIDFEGPQVETHKALFAPGTVATIGGTKSAAAMAKSRASAASESALGGGGGVAGGGSAGSEWCLPEDFGFSGKKLLRLFLKPRTSIKVTRRKVRAGFGGGGYGDDGSGIAGPMVMDDSMMDMGGMDLGDFDNGDDDNDPAPFATQFLLADEDDDLHYPDDEDEDDDIQATLGARPTRVRPEKIGHATRAKRVDVKKLKESIWKELEDVVIPVKELPQNPRYDAEPEAASRAEAFVPVLAGLRAAYPEDKMEEISTSFCFICLLHLANEKGLRIQAPPLEEDEGRARNVGGIDRLRVLKPEVSV